MVVGDLLCNKLIAAATVSLLLLLAAFSFASADLFSDDLANNLLEATWLKLTDARKAGFVSESRKMVSGEKDCFRSTERLDDFTKKKPMKPMSFQSFRAIVPPTPPAPRKNGPVQYNYPIPTPPPAIR